MHVEPWVGNRLWTLRATTGQTVERLDFTDRPVVRERHDGKPELIAEGYDYRVPMSLAVAGVLQSWTERRVVVRSMRQAQASERALRARVAKAIAAVEALNQCGRGKKRCEEVSALRQTVVTIVQRYGVEEFLWLRYRQHATPRRASCERTGIGPLGSRKTARRLWRSV